jgi:hypothetical protein
MSFHFLLMVVCAALLTACGRSDSSRITTVLEKCAAVGRQSSGVPGGQSAQAAFIAREFQKIDVTACPADFRTAYQAHVFAWQQAAAPLGNNHLGTAILERIASGLTEDPRYLGQAAQQAQYASQQINGTYFNLTQVAARYGARIPQSEVR